MGTKAVPAKPSELVILAINNLEEKDGSTSHDIAKFISQEFMMKQEEVTPRVQEALKRALTYGILVVKDGKYKLHDFPKQTNTTNSSVDETRSVEPDTSSKVTRNSKANNKKARKRASPVKKVRTKKKLPVKTARKTKVRKVTKKTCKRCLSRAAPI